MHLGELDRAAGGGDALERALVRPGDRAAGDDQIAFCDDRVDRDVDVGKRGDDHLAELLHARAVERRWADPVRLVGRRHELVDDGMVRLVLELLLELEDDGLVLGLRGARQRPR